MDLTADKNYVDACVQTSPVICATVVQVEDSDLPGAILKEDFQASVASPALVSLLQPTSTSKCNATGTSETIRSRTPLRAIKNSLPFARPSQFAGLVVEDSLQRRIVSLPEGLGADVLKDNVARSILTESRSVSMPAAYRHFATLDSAPEERNIARNTPSFSTDCEGDSHIQVSFRSHGLPETPSPPSSPESIEIIENNAHLPDSFLHTKRKQRREANEYDEAAEWLTWSSSPPKPIPALHGPASLPYARCPSGAEGTVLEERSTAPGLIWGLTDEASNSENSRSQFPSIFNDSDINSHPSHAANQTACTETIKSSAPTSQTSDGILEAMNFLRIQDDNSHRLSFAHQDTVTLPKHVGQIRPMELSTKFEKQVAIKCNGTTERMPAAANKNGIASGAAIKYDSQLLSETSTSLREVDIQGRNAEQHIRSNTLLDSLLAQHPSELNAAAAAFIPARVTHPPRNVVQPAFTSLSIAPRSSNQPQQESPRSGNFFFPPTESSSPVWSEPQTPLLETPPLHSFSMLSLATPNINTASPIFGRDSAFEQLKQLALYQKNLETLNNLRQALQIGSTSVHQTNCSSLPYRPSAATTPSAFSRPCMPINLHNLVASQSPTFSPLITSTSVSPTVFLPFSGAMENMRSQNVDVVPSDMQTTPISSSNLFGELRKHTQASRRYPRSIPLNRMLERRLSSVPEETSTMTSDDLNSSSMTHATQDVSICSSADDIKSSASPPSTQGQRVATVLRKPVHGEKRAERIFRPKKTQPKTRGKNTINVVEQENVEPKDQAISQKRWKGKQGGAPTKGKSKTLNSRHKDE